MKKKSGVIVFNKKEIKDLICIIALSTVLPSISTYIYKLIGDIIDINIQDNQNTFWTIVIIVLSSNLLYYCLTRLKIQLNGNFTLNIISKMRKKFSSIILDGEIENIESSTNGKLISLFNNNISGLKFLIEDILSLISNVLIIVIMLTYIALNNVEFLLFCITSLCFSIYLAYLLGKTLGALSKDINENQHMVSQSIVDVIKGYEAIRIYNLQSLFAEKFKKQCDIVLEKNLKLEKKLIIIGATTVLLNIVPVILCIAYGSYLVQRQVISVGVLISFIPIVTKLSQTIGYVFNLGGNVKAQLPIVDGLKEVLELPVERVDGDFMRPVNSDIAINFDSVSFGYGPKKVLNNVSFLVANGKKIGIAGPSGCGKSTVLKLINGLYSAQNGSISIYDQDINRLALNDVRDIITFVPQKTHLYPLSLEENIRFENRLIKRSEIVTSLRRVNLGKFVEELDVETELNRYINLSGGEMQRIGIVRGLLTESKIYIFDEPTAQLDTETKDQVINEILSINNKTCIVVSHDLSVLKAMDEVILFNDGKVVGQGNHDGLMISNSLYNEFCIKGEFYEK